MFDILGLDGQKTMFFSDFFVYFLVDLPDIVFIGILFLVIDVLSRAFYFFVSVLDALTICFLSMYVDGIIMRLAEHGCWLIHCLI